MSKKRRRISRELKFTIVFEAIIGQQQIAEITTEHDVYPNQISTWKRQFLEQESLITSRNIIV